MLNFLWVTEEGVYPPNFSDLATSSKMGKAKSDNFKDQIKASKSRGFKPETVMADVDIQALIISSASGIRSGTESWDLKKELDY